MTTEKQSICQPATKPPRWARRAAWGVVTAAAVVIVAVVAAVGGAVVSAVTTGLARTGVSPIPPMPVTGGILMVLLVWLVTLALPALAAWAVRTAWVSR